MIYTSGIWHTEDDTLEQAQINKMELIAQKIHLKQGDKHLDLGCGWGTFINYCTSRRQPDTAGAFAIFLLNRVLTICRVFMYLVHYFLIQAPRTTALSLME